MDPLTYFVIYIKCIPQSHLWRDTCWPLGGRHGALAALIFVTIVGYRQFTLNNTVTWYKFYTIQARKIHTQILNNSSQQIKQKWFMQLIIRLCVIYLCYMRHNVVLLKKLNDNSWFMHWDFLLEKVRPIPITSYLMCTKLQ